MKKIRSFSDDSIGSDRRAEGAAGPALAYRPDFELDGVFVRPSLRTVEGADAKAKAEPRVMQVLLALVDAGGAVVTQDELIERCWNGTIVGVDSIHRAIGEARRVLRAAGARFAIETIPKTGYRLALPDGRAIACGAMPGDGGAIGEAETGDETPLLLERCRQLLRHELPDGNVQAIAHLRRATAIDPANAEAWGLLALAHRNAAENGSPETVSEEVQASEAAARRGLAIDPKEGNALTALATLQPYFGDWLAAEDSLRYVLAAAPDNAAAIGHLVTLLQSVGRTQASWEENERAIALEPLSPVHQFRKALKSWILGDDALSDLVIDRAVQIWPRHPAVWNARLMLFAFTGRAEAALAMLDDAEGRPATMAGPALELWRVALRALGARTCKETAAACAAHLDAARRSPGFAWNAVMTLSALGQLDAAFMVTDGLFLRQGPLIGSLWTGQGQMPVNDQHWRRTMFLYTPPCAPMRADPRFTELCDQIGLMRYWERRGVMPDHLIAGQAGKNIDPGDDWVGRCDG